MEHRSSTKIGLSLRQTDLLLSVLLVLAILGLFPAMWAQTSTTGILKGVVTDPSGRLVANVDVRVTNQATGEVRTVKTGADGAYTVPLLPPDLIRSILRRGALRMPRYQGWS